MYTDFLTILPGGGGHLGRRGHHQSARVPTPVARTLLLPGTCDGLSPLGVRAPFSICLLVSGWVQILCPRTKGRASKRIKLLKVCCSNCHAEKPSTGVRVFSCLLLQVSSGQSVCSFRKDHVTQTGDCVDDNLWERREQS